MNLAEILLTMSVSVLSGVFGVITWLIKDKLRRYDKHLEECQLREIERATATESTGQRLSYLETQMDAARIQLHWFGDCMMVMGVKLDLKLPERPR